MKRTLSLLLALLMAFALVGCVEKETPETEVVPAEDVTTPAEEMTEAEFTDDAGRTVTLPGSITKIAPSGVVAQFILYSYDDTMLVGIARDNLKKAPDFFTEHALSLPAFGQFYGKNVDLNLEALMVAAPDVIIDMGEKKDTIGEDMDMISEQTGIPAVFIEATLETMPQAFQRLGELLGDTARAAALSEDAARTLERAKMNRDKIEEPVTAYLALGENGLSTNAKDSFHNEVLNVVGVENVIDEGTSTKGGGTDVSLETLILKQPDVILTESAELRDQILADEAWQALTAVQEGKVIAIPAKPFSYLFNPPSVNRIIGVDWLGHTLYPELYDFDITERMIEYYKLYFHVEKTPEEIEKILNP